MFATPTDAFIGSLTLTQAFFVLRTDNTEVGSVLVIEDSEAYNRLFFGTFFTYKGVGKHLETTLRDILATL